MSDFQTEYAEDVQSGGHENAIGYEMHRLMQQAPAPAPMNVVAAPSFDWSTVLFVGLGIALVSWLLRR